jgi:hypothetical protein
MFAYAMSTLFSTSRVAGTVTQFLYAVSMIPGGWGGVECVCGGVWGREGGGGRRGTVTQFLYAASMIQGGWGWEWGGRRVGFFWGGGGGCKCSQHHSRWLAGWGVWSLGYAGAPYTQTAWPGTCPWGALDWWLMAADPHVRPSSA